MEHNATRQLRWRFAHCLPQQLLVFNATTHHISAPACFIINCRKLEWLEVKGRKLWLQEIKKIWWIWCSYWSLKSLYRTLTPTLSPLPVSLQSSINDGADFKAVADAMKVIGFTGDEIQTVYKILATILHLVTLDNIEPLLFFCSRQLCPTMVVSLCVNVRHTGAKLAK